MCLYLYDILSTFTVGQYAKAYRLYLIDFGY